MVTKLLIRLNAAIGSFHDRDNAKKANNILARDGRI